MALYCSRDVFKALDGITFPATREDLLEYAEANDASEAVIVSLDQLDETIIYRDIGEVCENARIRCSIEVISVLVGAPFPASREQLLTFAEEQGAPESVIFALKALPSSYTFASPEELCELVL